jgi:hypothetical protein
MVGIGLGWHIESGYYRPWSGHGPLISIFLKKVMFLGLRSRQMLSGSRKGSQSQLKKFSNKVSHCSRIGLETGSGLACMFLFSEVFSLINL